MNASIWKTDKSQHKKCLFPTNHASCEYSPILLVYNAQCCYMRVQKLRMCNSSPERSTSKSCVNATSVLKGLKD